MNIEILILDILAAIILCISSISVTIYYFKKEKEDKQNNEFIDVKLSSIGSELCIGTVMILCVYIFKMLFI